MHDCSVSKKIIIRISNFISFFLACRLFFSSCTIELIRLFYDILSVICVVIAEIRKQKKKQILSFFSFPHWNFERLELIRELIIKKSDYVFMRMFDSIQSANLLHRMRKYNCNYRPLIPITFF